MRAMVAGRAQGWTQEEDNLGLELIFFEEGPRKSRLMGQASDGGIFFCQAR